MLYNAQYKVRYQHVTTDRLKKAVMSLGDQRENELRFTYNIQTKINHENTKQESNTSQTIG